MDRIDHVVVVVENIAAEAARIMDDYGFDVVPAHELGGYGLRSAAIPLGDQLLSLIEVSDRGRALTSNEGRGFLDRLASGERLGAWSVRTDDLDAHAHRLGLETVPGFHTLPDGMQISWRTLGLEAMMADPSVPYFIEWPHAERFPGRRAPEHRINPLGIAWVEVVADEGRLRNWLGEHRLPLRCRGGEPHRIVSVSIRTERGEIVFR